MRLRTLMKSTTKSLKKQTNKLLKVAYLGIGTNKGLREKNILLALELLNKNPEIKISKISKLLKNPPQEGVKTGYFLNGAIKLLTTLNPTELLRFCKRIERKLGRNIQSSTHKKRPRTIDLDILFYENKIITTNKLIIPHPMLHKRYFVLIPLLEIGRNIIHPVYKTSIGKLYNNFFESKKFA